MIKRIVEISSAGYLFTRNRQLYFKKEQGARSSIPIEDIGVLVLDNPALSYSQSLLNQCLANNTCVILCNNQHLPHAILYPTSSNTLHHKIIHQQFSASKALQKRLWQSIIQAKIKEQAQNLELCCHKNFGLQQISQRILSGDTSNLEGQAAKIYWKKLFGKTFCRNFQQIGINSLLNYGYAIMRGLVARAIAATGLHPAIGIHHSNQYNVFCLADDLMEPLRPMVDRQVFQICSKEIPSELTPEIKKKILGLLTNYCQLAETSYLLFTGVQIYVASFKKRLLKQSKDFLIPKFLAK